MNTTITPKQVASAMAILGFGPSMQAGDDSQAGLAAAEYNAGLVRRHWCKCQENPENQVYWRRETGSHGWMCINCLGITQLG